MQSCFEIATSLHVGHVLTKTDALHVTGQHGLPLYTVTPPGRP
uniref:Uncharacterized protein n=1 Tax=Romanomermis culicivorax TaxID=13658 RepID=A0A915K616_ROMCU